VGSSICHRTAGLLRTCFFPSPEGTTLCQPRVERRERSERRATLGQDCLHIQSPNGAALILPRWVTKIPQHVVLIALPAAQPILGNIDSAQRNGPVQDLGPPLQGSDWNGPSHPRVPRRSRTHVAPPWADLGTCLWH